MPTALASSIAALEEELRKKVGIDPAGVLGGIAAGFAARGGLPGRVAEFPTLFGAPVTLEVIVAAPTPAAVVEDDTDGASVTSDSAALEPGSCGAGGGAMMK